MENSNSANKSEKNSSDSDIIKAQKTKYFINKQYQRFISLIYFLIGCYFLYCLFCFLISVYVSKSFYSLYFFY